jgi:hypothetical protein
MRLGPQGLVLWSSALWACPSGPLQYPTATAEIPRTTPPSSWLPDLTASLCRYTGYFSYIMSLRHVHSILCLYMEQWAPSRRAGAGHTGNDFRLFVSLEVLVSTHIWARCTHQALMCFGNGLGPYRLVFRVVLLLVPLRPSLPRLSPLPLASPLRPF